MWADRQGILFCPRAKDPKCIAQARCAREEYSARIKAKFAKLSKKRRHKNKSFAAIKDIPQDAIDTFVAKYKDQHSSPAKRRNLILV